MKLQGWAASHCRALRRTLQGPLAARCFSTVAILKLQGWAAAHCRASRHTLQGPTPRTARFSIKVLGRTLQGTSPHTAGPGRWLPWFHHRAAARF